MKRIFSYLNNLSAFAKGCLICTTALSLLILLLLIPLRFLVFQSYSVLYVARFAVTTAAALFCEGLLFSCVIHTQTKKQN